MIDQTTVNEIIEQLSDLMIPADMVAHVADYHSLSHAMLILTSVKYSMIPVLSADSTLQGLINMSAIVQSMVQLDGINADSLDEKQVKDAMLEVPVKVTLEDSFETIFRHLVDHNFLCVVDESGLFIGMITRRNLLKRLNRYFHDKG